MKDKGSPLTIKHGMVVKCRKKVTEVVIPDGVRKIGECAFYECKSLTSVVIPQGVAEIDNLAFNNCKSLASVELPKSLRRIGSEVFFGCDALSNVRYGGTKEQFVHIEGVSYLNSRLVGTGVLCVDGTLKLEEKAGGFRMFGSMVYSHTDNDPVTLNIPESATKIGDMVIFDSKLTSLMIPSSVMEIGKYAFEGCESLVEIRFGGTMAQWEAVKKRANWYLHTPVIQVKCSDGEVPLPPYTIKNGVLEIWYRNDTELVVPEGVVRIGEYAFSGCHSLISVTIPESVTEIDVGAFYYCESLTKVMLPESIAKIGMSAFFNCKSLAEIRFGGTVAEWEAVKKDEDWNSGIPAKVVHCSDGDATL